MDSRNERKDQGFDVASGPEDEPAPESYIRPSRAPWVIGTIALAVGAVVALFALSVRPGNLSSVQAVINEAQHRDAIESAREDSRYQDDRSSSSIDRDAVLAMLQSTLVSAGQACGISFEPGAEVHVHTTVQPKGTIENMEITNAPFAQSAMGSCIANKLSKTRVPTFEGGDAIVNANLVVR